jgi:DUF4097 and DUF4098 domain-containing protein YvlB
MKQTAVEQFLDAIKNQISLSNEHLEMIESYASQAKEMEKQQIIDATIYGNRQDFYDGTEMIGNEYYNEQFKNK